MKTLWALLSTWPQLYAHQQLEPNWTVETLQAFIALLLLSGYVPDPRCRTIGIKVLTYFCNEEILRRYLHFADNTVGRYSDKMTKVRPLVDHLNKRYKQYWPGEEDLDIGESMIPYYGHHSSKQFIHGKLILTTKLVMKVVKCKLLLTWASDSLSDDFTYLTKPKPLHRVQCTAISSMSGWSVACSSPNEAFWSCSAACS